MTTLVELNALRVANNMKPLKAWKESKAKLDAAVAKLSGITPTEQALKASVEITKVPTGMTAAKLEAVKAKAAKEKLNKAIKKGTTVERKVKKSEAGEENVLSTVCVELDKNQKVARAALRREFGKKEEGKWPSTVKAMKEFLEVDKRKS